MSRASRVGRVMDYEIRQVPGPPDVMQIVVKSDTKNLGIGETLVSNDPIGVAIELVFDEYVKGSRVEEVGRCVRAMTPYVGFDGSGVELKARCIVELALWDLLTDSLAVPLSVLFGGQVRDRVELFAYNNLGHLGDHRMATALQGGSVSELQLKTYSYDRWTSDASLSNDERAIAIRIEGHTLRQVYEALDNFILPDFLLASPSLTGPQFLGSLSVISEMAGCALLLEGNGSKRMLGVATELGLSLPSVAGIVVDSPQ